MLLNCSLAPSPVSQKHQEKWTNSDSQRSRKPPNKKFIPVQKRFNSELSFSSLLSVLLWFKILNSRFSTCKIHAIFSSLSFPPFSSLIFTKLVLIKWIKYYFRFIKLFVLNSSIQKIGPFMEAITKYASENKLEFLLLSTASAILLQQLIENREYFLGSVLVQQ